MNVTWFGVVETVSVRTRADRIPPTAADAESMNGAVTNRDLCIRTHV